MKSNFIIIVTSILIAGCSDKAENQSQPKSQATIISSISNDPDPEKREKFNREMVESMYDDDMVPAELIPGEAFRRGVELDQERLDAKIAREKAKG